MALDRLDAVVIGAGIEGLAAALALAKAGRAVVVVEREVGATTKGEGEAAVLSAATARALDLAGYGLRFASAPAVAAATADQALVLWPTLHAAQSAIAAISPRDGEALEGFIARIARAAAARDERAISAWLVGGANGESAEAMAFRSASLARVLSEAFDNDLVKGVWAQTAVMGTGASPYAPGSAALLLRPEVLAAVAPELGYRFVSGGRAALKAALLAAIDAEANGEVRFGADVRQIFAERDVVQAVILSDSSAVRAPLVVSTLGDALSREMIAGLRRVPPRSLASGARVEPAHVKFGLKAPPKLAGVDAATLASGAIVRLNPSLARLRRAHGAFGGLTIADEPAIEFCLVPAEAKAGKHWSMLVTLGYLPPTTIDGPWTAARRERISALCVRAIETISPGFGASIEDVEILSPLESVTVMDPRGAAELLAKASQNLTGVPDIASADATTITKGLTLLSPSTYRAAGEAGMAAAGLALGTRKAKADA